MSYRNQKLLDRMAEVLPGFKVIPSKEKRPDGKPKCPRYVNWPTIDASLSPLRSGRAASLSEIKTYLDATDNGGSASTPLDHPELTKQVRKEIRQRQRENRIRGRSHSFARSEHGYIF